MRKNKNIPIHKNATSNNYSQAANKYGVQANKIAYSRPTVNYGLKTSEQKKSNSNFSLSFLYVQ